MKKIFLVLALGVISNFSISQHNFPTKAECEKYIQSNSEVKKEVVEKLGVEWNKLTIVSDNWRGYKGTVFSLSVTDCGYNIRKRGNAWPDDAAYAKWVVTTPKNAEGIYKELAIYMDYKRTTFDGEYCKLGSWHFNGYRVEGGAEYGHKEFTTQEIKDIFFKSVEKGDIKALNNFIEIKEITEDRDFNQNVPQPGQRYLYVYFKGTEGNFADDHSVMYCSSESGHKMTLSVTKVDDEWIVTNSKIDDRDPAEEALPLGQYCYMDDDEAAENYESYKTGGWKAIYGTKTKRSTTEGKYGKLMARMKQLNEMLLAKGAELQADDLAPFVRPEAHDGLNNEKTNISASNQVFYLPYLAPKDGKSLQLTEHSFGGASLMSKELEDGSIIEFGLPNVKMKFSWIIKKGKKWTPYGSSTSNHRCTSEPDGNHFQVWVYQNDNWFLYDVESAFCASSKASDNVIETLGL